MKMEQLLELRKRAIFPNIAENQYALCTRTYNYKLADNITVLNLIFEANSFDGVTYDDEIYVDKCEYQITPEDERKQGTFEDEFVTTDGNKARNISVYKDGKIIQKYYEVFNDEMKDYELKNTTIYMYNENKLINYTEYAIKPYKEGEEDTVMIPEYAEDYYYDEEGNLIEQYVRDYDTCGNLANSKIYEFAYEGDSKRTTKEYEIIGAVGIDSINEPIDYSKSIKKLINDKAYEEFYDEGESLFAFNGINGYQIVAQIDENLTICEDYVLLDASPEELDILKNF